MVRKQAFNHPVRFIAKDARDIIIAAGTVSQNRPHETFLVHQNTGFQVANVGTWPLEVAYPP